MQIISLPLTELYLLSIILDDTSSFRYYISLYVRADRPGWSAIFCFGSLIKLVKGPLIFFPLIIHAQRPFDVVMDLLLMGNKSCQPEQAMCSRLRAEALPAS